MPSTIKFALFILHLWAGILFTGAMPAMDFHRLLEREKYEDVASALNMNPDLKDLKGGEHPPVHPLVTAVTGMIDPTPDRHVVQLYASDSKLKIIRLLIETYGADVNMKIEEMGVRIIDIAASVANGQVVDLLLESGANPLLPIEVMGTTFSTVQIACFWGNFDAMEAIVRKAPISLKAFENITWGDQVPGVPEIFEKNIPACKEKYLEIVAALEASKKTDSEEL